MIIKCPACRKKNSDLSSCKRCYADLSDLIFIKDLSALYLKMAKKFIRSNQLEKAYDYSTLSYNMIKNVMAAKVSLLLSVSLQKYDESKRWHGLVREKAK